MSSIFEEEEKERDREGRREGGKGSRRGSEVGIACFHLDMEDIYSHTSRYDLSDERR